MQRNKCYINVNEAFFWIPLMCRNSKREKSVSQQKGLTFSYILHINWAEKHFPLELWIPVPWRFIKIILHNLLMERTVLNGFKDLLWKLWKKGELVKFPNWIRTQRNYFEWVGILQPLFGEYLSMTPFQFSMLLNDISVERTGPSQRIWSICRWRLFWLF